jgi:hypothetical protein
MARVIKPIYSYQIEKLNDDEVTMHFPIHGPVTTRTLMFWAWVKKVSKPFGWIPGLALGFSVMPIYENVIPITAIVWLSLIILSFFSIHRELGRQHKQTSPYRQLSFTRDTIKTTQSNVLMRTDIRDAFVITPNTRFTYRSNAEFHERDKQSDLVSKLCNAVCVTYGSEVIEVTHQSLLEAQAQDISNAISRWVMDPETLFFEASKATISAAA